jgi:hypothetical protein
MMRRNHRFRLIEAHFAAVGIRLQKLKYDNALASLPKQVFQNILDTIAVCNDSDQPFHQLKKVLLGQFGKSKCQSYFDLLCLPMEMQYLNSSILIGKLKQHLPPGVSPDTDLFLAMFLIRLPPSMREVVGAGNHKTAAAIVKAADAFWDAWGGHDPTVAAATTQRRMSPAPANRKKSDKRSGNALSKSSPPSRHHFYSFTTLAKGSVNFTITMPTRLTGVFHPVLGWKTKKPSNPYRFSGNTSTRHSHGHAFPGKCRTHFLD